MRRLSLGTIAALVCGAIVGVAVPAEAQDTPAVEVSGGYQFIHVASGADEGETLANGWYGDVAGNVTKAIGIVFQVGGNYKTETESVGNAGVVINATVHIKVHQFLGGVRFNARENPRVTPFAHVLMGAFHISGSGEVSMTADGEEFFATSSGDSVTKFELQVGGGVNFMLSKKFGIRTGADYVHVFAEEGGLNIFRIAVGGVVTF